MSKPKRPAVDPRCFDLAAHFLEEFERATVADIWTLAKLIQDACEDACREIEQREEKRAS